MKAKKETVFRKVVPMIVVSLCLFGGTNVSLMGSPIPLDITSGMNWDAYISSAEFAEAESYADHPTIVNRRVQQIFGQNSLWGSPAARSYVFQGQTAGGAQVGLPDNGVIVAGNWTFHLRMQLDIEPAGGWGLPTFPDPNPTLAYELPANVIRLTGTGAGASATVMLSGSQQGNYHALNLLFASAGGGDALTGASGATITAHYSDGDVTLWSGGYIPGINQTLVSFADVAPDSAAVISPAIVTNRHWDALFNPERSSMTQRAGHFPTMWMFSDDGLPLDPSRVFEGFTVSRSAGVNTYIFAASVIPEPGMIALYFGIVVGLTVVLIRRRRWNETRESPLRVTDDPPHVGLSSL